MDLLNLRQAEQVAEKSTILAKNVLIPLVRELLKSLARLTDSPIIDLGCDAFKMKTISEEISPEILTINLQSIINIKQLLINCQIILNTVAPQVAKGLYTEIERYPIGLLQSSSNLNILLEIVEKTGETAIFLGIVFLLVKLRDRSNS